MVNFLSKELIGVSWLQTRKTDSPFANTLVSSRQTVNQQIYQIRR